MILDELKLLLSKDLQHGPLQDDTINKQYKLNYNRDRIKEETLLFFISKIESMVNKTDVYFHSEIIKKIKQIIKLVPQAHSCQQKYQEGSFAVSKY